MFFFIIDLNLKDVKEEFKSQKINKIEQYKNFFLRSVYFLYASYPLF